MTAIAHAGAEVRRRRGIAFWVRRYLAAELVGTVTMVVAGLGIALWTQAPALIALAALVGEIVGFYTVIAAIVYLEQLRAGRRRAAPAAAALLVAEFGAAELLDTLVVRPAALMLGVLLIPDAIWGLLAGKIAADLVFYAVAAGAFTITERAGLRGASTGKRS